MSKVGADSTSFLPLQLPDSRLEAPCRSRVSERPVPRALLLKLPDLLFEGLDLTVKIPGRGT